MNGVELGRQRAWGMRAIGFIVIVIASSRPALAQLDYDRPPIRYSATEPTDAVSALQKRIDAGTEKLAKTGDQAYLAPLLSVLHVSKASQVLVFSKTSFQRKSIGPQTPRALYFDDDTYVGYVQGGDQIEIAGTDPALGPTFYTLDQSAAVPKLVRQTDSCLQCHGGSMTRDTPGLLMRSVRSDPQGQPILTAGTKFTTHESPFAERFGGWYVTGRHGGFALQPHSGNLIGKSRDDPDPPDATIGADVTDLSRLFDTSAYLVPHSDLVALMVLSHQVEAHNLMTRASYACRFALRDSRVMNEALGLPAGELSESAKRRIESPAEALVKYLLFSDEAPLAAPVSGTSDYAKEFAARGPRDAKGRSLRDFDLKTRTFRYPLSYLIYSQGFDGLPAETKAYVYRRLFDVLNGAITDKSYAHLSPGDRRAILEIVRDTKKELPDYWRDAK